MRLIKNAVCAGLACFALATAANVAQASPITGLFGLSIYEGPGNGAIGDPNNQADATNGLLSLSGALKATGTYNGAINFAINDPQGSLTNIGQFLATGGGVTLLDHPSVLGDQLSTTSFGNTTLFVFTGLTGGAIQGSATHDDGLSILNTDNNLYALHSPIPVASTTEPYNAIPGITHFTIYYVEANGDPADLIIDSERNSILGTPLPAALPLFAGGVGLLGFFGRRRKRKIAAA